MSSNNNNEDDFVQGIGPKTAPKNLQPGKHEFKPWHKPRKHWLRINQWCKQTTELIKQLKNRENKTLTYLSLPGTDMLDVRAVHSECIKHGYSLKYLGFNDPGIEIDNEQTELNISRHELNSLVGIHPDSLIIPDRFEAIATPNKVAFQHLQGFGSFDVVNLDLCNSVAAHVPLAKQETYFSAILALLEHQSRNRVDPWLLFITTRVDDKTVQPEALRRLLECLKANIIQHETFRDDLKSFFGLNEITIANATNGKSQLNPHELYHAFCVGFGKWLLHFMGSGQPAWTVDMLDSWSYQVNAKNIAPDMLSLAYKCKQIVAPKKDHFKLGENHHKKDQASISERDAAIKLIPIVKAIENLDTKLSKNSSELKKVIEDAAKLMGQARYDSDLYRKWASK
jgi:hypothetical protein